MAEIKRFEKWKPFAVMVAIDLSFAAVNILLKKALDGGINHLVLITYRLSTSTIFLAPIAYFWERDSRQKLSLRILCYLFFSAIVGASLTQYCFLLGIEYTSATFACAFINIVPVVTFVMALPLGLERVNIKSNGGRAKVIGTLVCICGAAMLTLYVGPPLFDSEHSEGGNKPMPPNHATKKSERWMVGSVALVIGTLLWSSWFLLQSNIGRRYPFQYSSTALMSFFGAIQSSVLSFSTGADLSAWALKENIEIGTILFAGMVGSGLCFVGMSWCVKKRGPVFTAAFSPLVQIMAAMFDIPILHEQFHLGSLLGSITVIMGLYILLWGKNKEMDNCLIEMEQAAQESKDKDTQLPAMSVSLPPRDSSCP